MVHGQQVRCVTGCLGDEAIRLNAKAGHSCLRGRWLHTRQTSWSVDKTKHSGPLCGHGASGHCRPWPKARDKGEQYDWIFLTVTSQRPYRSVQLGDYLIWNRHQPFSLSLSLTQDTYFSLDVTPEVFSEFLCYGSPQGASCPLGGAPSPPHRARTYMHLHVSRCDTGGHIFSIKAGT